jgi:predicted dehydrogenase
MTRPVTRRQALAAGAILTLPAATYRRAFAADPPSERVRVGMIGVGNQGGPSNNLKYFLPASDVVALCDVEKDHLAKSAAFCEKPGKKPDLLGDYRKLLDRKDVDAVVVTVPDQWHALMTVQACRAGKDVYCEKPLTLTIGEGPLMVNAARQHKRVVQTGSMQRSGQEFITAVKLVRDGAVGKVREVKVTLPPPNWTDRAKMPVPNSPPPDSLAYDAWLGPAPHRPYNKNHVHYLFRFFWDYSGGQQTNFGAHHLDVAQWGLGMDASGPVAVEVIAKYHPQGWYETPDFAESRYTYADGTVLTCRLGGDFKKNEQQGTEFVGDKGSLFVHRGGIRASSPDMLKGVEWDRKASSNVAHVADFLRCIKSRRTPAADVAIGHRSATVCHLGNLAVRLGRPLKWDPQSERFVGDPEADKWLTKEYRKGYSLA